jgi:hypothetical protein
LLGCTILQPQTKTQKNHWTTTPPLVVTTDERRPCGTSCCPLHHRSTYSGYPCCHLGRWLRHVFHFRPLRLVDYVARVAVSTPDSTSTTMSNNNILPPPCYAHRDRLRDLLCRSSQIVAYVHSGPYLRSSSIGNTGVCIHPRRIPRSSKFSTRLVQDGFDSIDFDINHLHHGVLIVSPSSSKAHP